MCEGVRFRKNKEILTSLYRHEKALLPVMLKSGEQILLPWGRKHGQPGELPFGGWAKLDAIHGGHWDRFFPIPVKIPCLYYMLIDHEGREKWYQNVMKQKIQGLLAQGKNERRVYIVTVEPDVDMVDFHPHSPRFVTDITIKDR